jgi:hypothetical protein
MVFIQNKKTNLFLTAAKEWTKELNKAMDFNRIIPAVDFCIIEKLESACLLVGGITNCEDRTGVHGRMPATPRTTTDVYRLTIFPEGLPAFRQHLKVASLPVTHRAVESARPKPIRTKILQPAAQRVPSAPLPSFLS